MLIHRRAETKDVWPGRWDLAVGGVVDPARAGRTPRRASSPRRSGVTRSPQEIGRGEFEDDAVRAIGRIYVARDDGPFEFVDGEVVEALFVTFDELRNASPATRSFPTASRCVWPLLSGERGDAGGGPSTT